MNAAAERQENLYDLLKEFDTTMMVTRSPDGHMHARPMAVAELLDGSDAYLVTGLDSPKVAEIGANPAVTLVFQSSNRFASVSGRATVVRDRALVDRLWKEGWKVWFPGGKTDPNLALLRFAAENGEYWDDAGAQGLKYAFQALKAYATGSTPKADDSQHAKVDL